MKTTGFFIYAFIIIAGAAVIAYMGRGSDVTLIASRALPAYHLLDADDLQLRTDGRQYLPRPLKKGEAIGSGEIGSLDDFVVGMDATPVAVTVSRDEVIRLKIETGDLIFLCPPNVPAVVHAVFCGNRKAPCIVAADVTDKGKLEADQHELSIRDGKTCK